MGPQAQGEWTGSQDGKHRGRVRVRAQLQGVVGPYGQDAAALPLWPQPSFVLAEFSGHRRGKMAISTSGFPGRGLAGEGWLEAGATWAHMPVMMAGWMASWVGSPWVSGPLLGFRGTGVGGGRLLSGSKWGSLCPRNECPPCSPTPAWLHPCPSPQMTPGNWVQPSSPWVMSGQKCSLYSKITYLIRRSELAGGSGGFVDFFRFLAPKPCDNVTVQLGVNFSLAQVMP